VGRGSVDGGEDTGGFHDIIDVRVAPRNGGGVSRVVDLDDVGFLAVIDDQVAVLDVDVSLEAAMDSVILEEVCHVVGVEERVVEGDDLQAGMIEYARAEDKAANTAKTVDAYFDWLLAFALTVSTDCKTLGASSFASRR